MKLVTIDAPRLDAGVAGRAGAMLANGEILDIARARRDGTPEAWIPTSVRAILGSVGATDATVPQSFANRQTGWGSRSARLPCLARDFSISCN